MTAGTIVCLQIPSYYGGELDFSEFGEKDKEKDAGKEGASFNDSCR